MSKSQNITTPDIVVIVIYLCGCIGVGLFSLWKSKRSTISGYFLAGKDMIWLTMGASIFASNIGSEHFIGLAGSGTATGLAMSTYEVSACITVQLLGWVFLPIYISSRISTLPEYMAKRFGGKRIKVYLSVLSLLLYILTKISVILYAAAIFMREAMAWNIWLAMLIMLALTTLMTAAGGLRSVLYTDTLQCIIMIAGSAVLCGLSFAKVSGWQGLVEKYPLATVSVASISEYERVIQSNKTYCYQASPQAFMMLQSVSSTVLPWLGFLFGGIPVSVWYWATDQMMVQRVLAARNLSHGQGATLFAGLLKFLPVFLIVLPGMIARILYTDQVACVDPDICEAECGQRSGCSNMAYPKLVINLMPSGLRGLMLAAILAAMMSGLSSVFNSASSLVTIDLWPIIRPRVSRREQMIVGRVSVLLLAMIGVAWVLILQEIQGGQLFVYLQAVQAYFATPIAAAYLLAISWRRINEIGTFYGLIYGLLMGIVRMIMEIVWIAPSCISTDPDPRPFFISHVNFTYHAMFFFITSGLLIVIVSLLSEKLHCSKQHRTIEELDVENLRRNLPDQNFELRMNFEDGTTFKSAWRLIKLSEEKRQHVLTLEKLNSNGVHRSLKIDGDSAPPSKHVDNNLQVNQSQKSFLNNSKKILIECWNWLWGLNLDDEEKMESFENQLDIKQKQNEEMIMQDMKRLEQSKYAKLLLNLALILIICITLAFFFIFCFIYPNVKLGPISIGNYTRA